MKKSLIAMAVGAALTAPLAVQAAPTVDVSGFADIIYTYNNKGADNTGTKPNGNGTRNTTERKFSADGEIDFTASPADGVTARLDVDLHLLDGGTSSCTDTDSNSGTGIPTTNTCAGTSTGSGATLEQAFFAWNIIQPLTLIGGVFNDPIGAEAEDAPNLNFTSHNAIFNILNNQTALNGNNVAGVALAAGNSMVTGTVAYLDDLQETNEKNSVAAVINVMPMSGLEFEGGYVTQYKNNPTPGAGDFGAGDVWDVNGSWGQSFGAVGASVGAEYLGTDEIFDGAYNIWAGIDLPAGLGLKARYEASNSDINGVDDTTAWTLYGSWQAASNLLIALEFTKVDADKSGALDGATGETDGNLVTAEFIANIGDFK